MRHARLPALTLVAAIGATCPLASRAQPAPSQAVPAQPAPVQPVPAPAPLAQVPPSAPATPPGQDAAPQTPAAPPPPVTAAQAQALEKQLATWLRTVTGNFVPLPPHLVQLRAEGDHYLVRIPLGLAKGMVTPPDAAFTAHARPLDATRWALEDEALPDKFTLTLPDPTASAPARAPRPPGRKPAVPPRAAAPAVITYQFALGKQDVHGTFDTSNTQPSSNSGTIASMTVASADSDVTSASRSGPISFETTLNPTDAGHFDLHTSGTAADYIAHTVSPKLIDIEFDAQTLRFEGEITRVAHDQIIPLMNAASRLSAMIHAPGGNAREPTPGEVTQLRAILHLTQDLLRGVNFVQSLEGVRYSVSGINGTLARLETTFDAQAPQSALALGFGMKMDGLQVANLPPGVADFVPSHLALHPTVANIDLAALTKLANDDLAAPDKATEPDPAVLLGPNGIDFGFDTLELEVAGARLNGTGKFNVKGTGQVTGEADLSATGLDQLITKLQASPALAQGAAAVIFLKGIAHTNADQALWQVTVQGPKVLVNGVDLTAMMAAMSH